MATKLKKIECEPSCGFLIRSHDDDEIVNAALKHVRDQHNPAATLAEARGWLAPA